MRRLGSALLGSRFVHLRRRKIIGMMGATGMFLLGLRVHGSSGSSGSSRSSSTV